MLLSLSLSAALLAQAIPTLRASREPGEQFSVDDCSIYCATTPSVSVSRHIARQDRFRYDARRIEDGLTSTAWVVDGGPKEWFEFTFLPGEGQSFERYGIDQLFLLNGYGKTSTHWRDHSRVRQLELQVDGKALALIELLDTPIPQKVALPKIPLHPGIKIRFVIASVYAGARFSQTAISEARVDGFGAH